MVGDIDDDDVLGLLVGGGLRRGQRQLDCALRCGHLSPSLAGYPRRIGAPPASHTGWDRYRRRLAMYCTTPSGTRYQMDLPAATRTRQSVDEIAMAGTWTRL